MAQSRQTPRVWSDAIRGSEILANWVKMSATRGELWDVTGEEHEARKAIRRAHDSFCGSGVSKSQRVPRDSTGASNEQGTQERASTSRDWDLAVRRAKAR
jgi:hypothetical protein